MKTILVAEEWLCSKNKWARLVGQWKRKLDQVGEEKQQKEAQ
jgi:hypothetical protein